MSIPRWIDIIPDCGLTIKVDVDKAGFKGIDHTHSSLAWEYSITNSTNVENHIIEPLLNGWISPTSRLTLPPKEKIAAGIPKHATTFAFMHPPEGLAEKLASAPDMEEACSQIFDCHQHSKKINVEAITSAVILGGFAYFDNHFNCIGINALSRTSSNNNLEFTGPLEANQAASVELYKMGRTQPLRLDIFREVGFVRVAWLRPHEKIRFKSVFKKYDNLYGALLFFRENGTATAYGVHTPQQPHPNGDASFVSEALCSIKKAKYTQKAFPSIFEVKAWGNEVKKLLQSETVTRAELIEKFRAELIEELDDNRTLIHKACHASLGAELIDEMLSNEIDRDNLSYQDKYGWNPLHYACRFSPNNCDLVKLLINKCPLIVTQPDHCGRYPLHIACDSDTSEEVITTLLMKDIPDLKQSLSNKTDRLGLLPIHFACFNGASYRIIKALLDADETGCTGIEPSEFQLLPLHLAIIKKLPADVVKMLLDIDSQNRTRDIYVPLRGKQKLALHVACFNNSSSKIINMLLEKDKDNITIDKMVPFSSAVSCVDQSMRRPTTNLGGYAKISNGDTETNGYTRVPNYDNVGTLTQLEEGNISSHVDKVNVQTNDGSSPLHLAMKNGSIDVINLLLKKELCEKSNLLKRDDKGMTPLHIACQNIVDPQIIRWLIELDPWKSSTQVDDNLGFRPLHYACEHINTNVEIINILCEAEELYIKSDHYEGTKRSTHSGDKERKITPLYLAIKNGASNEVIEKLLQPENFILKGFDDPTLTELADIVKDSVEIQDKVTARLAKRFYFGIIIAELLADIFAIIACAMGSQKLYENEFGAVRVEPALLILCAVLFIMRELLQILSVGIEYIGDKWSWIELLSIIFMFIAAAEMYNEDQEYKKRDDTEILESFYVKFVLNATILLTTMQLIIYLRSTSLPFARFVGGFLTILRCLVPFTIVTALIVLCFIYSYWITQECGDDLPSNEYKDFSRCAQMTLSEVFNYEGFPEHRTSEGARALSYLFSYFIVIVLLNVVIAIVVEAWKTATDRATTLFWKFRLEKVNELDYVREIEASCTKKLDLLNSIDEVEDIQFQNDSSWTKPPFDVMKEKDHYDRPFQYFNDDLATKIYKSRSLQGELYWAEMDIEEGELTSCQKFIIIFKWLGSCIFYLFLIIVGILTFGVTWPKSFRCGFLSLGRKKDN